MGISGTLGGFLSDSIARVNGKKNLSRIHMRQWRESDKATTIRHKFSQSLRFYKGESYTQNKGEIGINCKVIPWRKLTEYIFK